MIEISFQEICQSLQQFSFPEVDVVIGIGTGGIVPACLVARQLNCDLQIIVINHRDGSNQISHAEPVVIAKPAKALPTGKRVLVVDDVSVSGKTLSMARKLLPGNEVITFALKGKIKQGTEQGTADLILFSQIADCVAWPWKT